MRGDAGDSTKYSFMLMFQLHKYELAVHRNSLEFVAVGHHDVGVELQAAFGEATEDTDDMIALEQCHVSSVSEWHAVVLLISAGGHVGGDPQLVDDRCEIGADLVANRVDQVVLNDIEV